jgi:hypothetical protein
MDRNQPYCMDRWVKALCLTHTVSSGDADELRMSTASDEKFDAASSAFQQSWSHQQDDHDENAAALKQEQHGGSSDRRRPVNC